MRELLIGQLTQFFFEGIEESDSAVSVSVKTEDAEPIEEFLLAASISFEKNVIAQQNWNARWEASYEPVNIFQEGNPLAQIRADFHEKDPRFLHDIIINPKMSFGTGHHATTALMIETSAGIDFSGKSVLDIGTGTGVLAIFAAQRGAEHVLATDNDPNSIDNAKENFQRNNAEEIQAVLREDVPAGKFDVIFANIILQTITDLLPNIANALTPKGFVLFSGVMRADEDRLHEEVVKNNLTVLAVSRRENWLCMLAGFN